MSIAVADVRFGSILLKKDFDGVTQATLIHGEGRKEQHRFKKPFAQIRLFRILIPQLHFGYFFNSIDPTRTLATAHKGVLFLADALS